jgi:hypothetical protein
MRNANLTMNTESNATTHIAAKCIKPVFVFFAVLRIQLTITESKVK